MADVSKTKGAPGEPGKNVKKIGEIKITVPHPPAGLSPQTSSPGTMESGPPPPEPPAPQKPPGQPGQGARPPVQPVQPLPPPQGPREGQGPPDSQEQSGPGSTRSPGPQPGPAPQDQLEMLAELARQEDAQKEKLGQQIQKDESAAGRAHLIELIAQTIVNGLEFIDRLLKLLGNIAKPIPVLGWIIQILVWIARGIVILLKFIPNGVAKGERKDEDRLRKRALKLRKEAGIKSPPPPDNPHGTTEIPAAGLIEEDVRFPVLNLVRPAPAPQPITLLPGLLKINPPLSGILKIFIIAGGAALLLISLGGLVTFMQSQS
ncbi:hypothetical protein HYW17_03165 [Candidatus Uhrbacteria bacterium]|nr:hypothetical protein [Candidatus Uhrbacteria bacterium]